tara:strand:- start:120 stop:449 length:330 start_codon:yes stop_codon:yes gene_type:complete
MDDNEKSIKNKLIIEGVDSKTGKKFRPNDWAERMSGSLSTFRNRRIIYSPNLRPAINKSGNKCMIVDDDLKNTNPALYNNIIEFAKKNKLKTNRNINETNNKDEDEDDK